MANRSTRILRRRIHALLTAGAAVAMSAQVASAIDTSWIAPGGGVFNSAANWDPSVPTNADVAIFNNNASGTVTFNADAAVNDLSFRNTSGALTIDTAGGSLNFNRFLLGTATGAPNDVTFRGGTFFHTSTGQVFSIGNANGANGNKLTITGQGVRVISTSTGTGSNIGIAGSNNNELNVTDGAFVDIRNTINVGIIGATPATGQVININNATFQITNGNRGIFLRQGTLNITNALADLGGFLDADDAGNTAVVNFNSGTLYSRATRIANGQPFRIGDGGAIPALFAMSFSGPTLVASDGIVIRSNGILSGTGIITGNVSGEVGAKVAPRIVGQPTLTTDDRNFGTMTVNGNWDNSNISASLTAGDFPTALAGDITPPFDPPINFLNISGSFTHGGAVTIDLDEYRAPQDQPYEYKMIGFGAEVGSSASTPVSFINGAPSTFDWRTDGLYVQFPQVPSGSAWNVDAPGSWNSAANWLGTIPNGVDETANLGTIITASQAISVDSPITLGVLNLNGGTAGYSVTGPAAITMDVAVGNAQIIAGGTASHAVGAALALQNRTRINVGASSSLSITGGITGGQDVKKLGAGPLTVGSISVGKLEIAAGNITLQSNGTSAGRADVTSLALAAGTSLDLTNNGVTIDYTGASPLASVRALIQSAYAGGAWTGPGVKTTLGAGFGVGYAEANSLSSIPTLFGSPDSTAVLLRGTRFGDANLSGSVNLDDFTALAAGFGQPGGWSNGDFNYDGVVNLDDFTSLAANFGLSTPADAARAAVPEPASLAVVLAGGLLALRRRRA